MHLAQAQDYLGPVTGIHSLKVSPLVTNSLVTPWQSSAPSTSSVLYTYMTYTFAFLKPSVGSSFQCPLTTLSVPDLYTESQLPTVPQCKPSPWTPWSSQIVLLSSIYTPESQLPIVPKRKPSPWTPQWVILDLCPSPSFPLSHNVSLPPGLFHGRGRCHRSCPLVSSHNTWAHKAHALASENLAPKLPQQWSNLDSLNCYPEPASIIRLRGASPDGSLCQWQFRWVCHSAKTILDWYSSEKL